MTKFPVGVAVVLCCAVCTVCTDGEPFGKYILYEH